MPENHPRNRRKPSRKPDPIKALRECRNRFRRSRQSARRIQYDTIASAIDFAREAKRDRNLMTRFLGLKEWPKRKKKRDPEDILRLSLQFAMGARDSGSRYNQACRYERCTRELFLGAMPVDQIAAHIKTVGGLNKLDPSLNKEPATPAASTKATPNSQAGDGVLFGGDRNDDHGGDDDDDDDDGAFIDMGTDDDGGPKPKPPLLGEKATTKDKKVNLSRIDVHSQIVLDAAPNHLGYLRRLEVGDKVDCLLEVSGLLDGDDWPQLKIEWMRVRD